MGSFAELYYEKDMHLSESRAQDLDERMKVVFRESGMMREDFNIYNGDYYSTLSKPKIKKDMLAVVYNYFNDQFWEDIGYSLKRHLLSTSKIGYGSYKWATFTAYELERRYIDGFSMLVVDNDPYTALERDSIGWMNYLFDENFELLNRNPWTIYEKMHEKGWRDATQYDRIEWDYNMTDAVGVWGYLSVRAVHEGTSAILGYYTRDDENGKKQNWIESLRCAIKEFQTEHTEPGEWQIGKLMEPLRLKGENALNREYWEENDDHSVKLFTFVAMNMSGLPIIVKVLSEIYEVDFWDIWKKYKHLPLCISMWDKSEPAPIEPVSTESMFRTTSDDLLILGLRAEKNVFSEEVNSWFGLLRDRYNQLLDECDIPANPKKWIHDLMKYADEAYYKVYAFTGFYEETMEHLTDRRYLTVWKIYEEMMHDKRMLDDVERLYVPKSENKYEERSIMGTVRRKLVRGWLTEFELADNNARKILRRYMALMDNKELRSRIFGF